MCEERRLAHVFVLSLITDSVINRHRHYITFALEISQLITGWATLGVIASLREYWQVWHRHFNEGVMGARGNGGADLVSFPDKHKSSQKAVVESDQSWSTRWISSWDIFLKNCWILDLDTMQKFSLDYKRPPVGQIPDISNQKQSVILEILITTNLKDIEQIVFLLIREDTITTCLSISKLISEGIWSS